MTQTMQSAPTSQIERQIDAVARKLHAQRIFRCAMLFLVFGLLGTMLAALTAHVAGQTRWNVMILVVWVSWIAASAWRWIARPLLTRPKSMEVARFIESRIDGLHNGLTNALLLARRADISGSPWLPPIYAEVARDVQQLPLVQAVQMRDLRPAAQRLLFLVVIPMIVLAALVPGKIAHGWQQLFHPVTFIPKVGAVQILDIQPRGRHARLRAAAGNHDPRQGDEYA